MKFYWKNYWKQDENLMGVYSFTDKATLIINLDSSLKSLNLKKVSKHIIYWRKADFAMGKIKSCYVVFNNKAIVIDRLLSRDEIKEVLKKK